jgi:hypothetical protein
VKTGETIAVQVVLKLRRHDSVMNDHIIILLCYERIGSSHEPAWLEITHATE